LQAHFAEEAARKVLEAPEYVGVPAIEFSNATGSCWRMSWLRSANCQEFQQGPEKSFERI